VKNEQGVLLRTKEFQIMEASIAELQQAMIKGIVTSVDLVRMYLDRIERYDKKGPAINAMVYLNEKAIETAKELDREREEKGPRGPLHGIPIIVKDNYDTFDMPTTASSLVLKDSLPPADSFIVAELRKAGAVIIGKSNMHEFAYGISSISSLGGQTFNPYALNRHPGGSSGGTGAAIAANFAAVGLGTDTGCSIRNPSSYNNLVGLRATYGLTSRSGIIPISFTQDVGGPMARSVSDVAVVMDVIAGKYDPRDPSTQSGTNKTPVCYAEHLKKDGLKGARIGILKEYFGDLPETKPTNRVIEKAIIDLEKQGAACLEISIANLSEADNSKIPEFEFETAINQYLESLGEGRPVNSLTEILESGVCTPGILKHLLAATGHSLEEPEYKKALVMRESFRESVEEIMDNYQLDAIMYPTFQSPPPLIGQEKWEFNNGGLSAYSGLPAISVPAGFTEDGLPIGMELAARSFEEGKLIELAYSYEQATNHRTPPKNTP
jgi:amidase